MPHPLLTSGLHSDGFADVLRVFSYPNLCELFARQFVMKLKAAGAFDDETPDRNGLITLATNLPTKEVTNKAAKVVGA